MKNSIGKIATIALALQTGLLASQDSLASTLYHNVKGYTFDKAEKFVEFNSVLIEDGKVVNIGNNLNVEADTRIDGKGKVMLPGLIDGHAHFMGLGTNLLQVNVRGLESADATSLKVAEYAKANPKLKWIVGRGWNQELWAGKSFPTASDLDKYNSNKPVVLKRVDGHAVWLNSKAMELAGITSATKSPKGGEIIKDENGEPTGVLIDNAENLVWSKVPTKGPEHQGLAFEKANEHLLSIGITSVHDAGIGYENYKFFKQKQRNDELQVRLYAMLGASDSKLADMLEQGIIQDNQDKLFIRSVKIYGDGALGSRGAALLKPYQDAPNKRGLLVTQPDKLRKLYDQIFAKGFQINIHAIGDRANKLALDEFQHAYKQYPLATRLRNRIEHAQVVHVDDIPRFKQLDVLPSMQPTHATSDKNMAENRIGKERLKGAYAWQTFLKQGSKVVSGSDFPVELANPFYGIHAAVTRQDRDNQPESGWLAHESLTVEQALKSFTLDAAYGAHQEKMLGSLEVGKWADFIIVDQDILKADKKDIWNTQVLETWIAGEKLYSKQ
jgi:predicted amidohydrolase YtcJ